MTLTRLPIVGLDAAAVDRWSALVERAVEPNVFLQPEFLRPAAEHLEGGARAELLVVEGDGRWLAAVAVVSRPKFSDLLLPCLRSWRHPYTFAGTPLMDRDTLAEASTALLGAADGARGRAFLALEHVSDGPVAAALVAAGEAAGRPVVVRDVAERAAVLRRPQDDYLATALTGKRRRELARTRRALDAELGAPTALVDVTDDPGALDRFLRLEGAGWKGEAGSALASDPRHERFQRASAAAFARRGDLRLLELSAAGRTAAIVLALRGNDTLYTLKIAHDEGLRRGTPGVHLMGEIASWMHATPGLDRVDSCAVPDNPMINHLWPDRVGLRTLVLPARGLAGRATRGLDDRRVAAAAAAATATAAAADAAPTAGPGATAGAAIASAATPAGGAASFRTLRARSLGSNDAARRTFATALRTVEAARPDLPVSRTWAWADAWLTHYGPRVPHDLVVVEDAAGTPVGATLLTRRVRRYGPIGLRSRCVGTGGEPRGEELCPEANVPAALPGRDAEVLRAVAQHAVTDRWWDELRLEGARAEDVAELVGAWPQARVDVKTRPSYQYDLAGLAPDVDVPGGLRGGPRRRVRTSLRAMEARGPLSLDWATTAPEASAILEDLIALHQDAWTQVGEPGVFASDSFAAFHRALAPQLVERGRATLVRVRCGEETIAGLYGFRDGDRLRAYQSGLRRFDDNRLRPGIVAHVLAMEEARRRGVALYDHLAGDARYKRELSTAEEPSSSYGLRRRRVRLALYDGAREARDRVRAARSSDG